MSKKIAYNTAIWVLSFLLLIMVVFVFDVFIYGEDVHKRYEFRCGNELAEKMRFVIENDSSLAAFEIRPFRTKDGWMTKENQLRRIDTQICKNKSSFYLFDFKSGLIFNVSIDVNESSLAKDFVLLFGTATISDYYEKSQQMDSIPLKRPIYITPICSVFSSYERSIKNSQLFEERILKKMELRYRSDCVLWGEEGSISYPLLPVLGCKQWFNARLFLIVSVICNMLLLGVFISLRSRYDSIINKKYRQTKI